MLLDGFVEVIPELVEVELCIIGAGAAGLSIAHELAGFDLTIAIADSGGMTRLEGAQNFNNAESTDRLVPRYARIRQFGGSTTAWSGKWLCLTPEDLTRKPWLQGSGWPIPHSELAEYYCRASEMHNGPALHDYVHWSPPPEAITKTRPAELLPVSVFWLAKMNLDFGATVGKPIKDSDMITTYIGTTVTEIVLSDCGTRVSHVKAITAKGDHTVIQAKSFVLAGGGIENARLMLASNSQMSNGVGNANDLVGRFYMDHPSGNVATVTVNKNGKLSEVMGQDVRSNGRDRMDIGMCFSPELREREQLANSYFVWRPVNDVEPSAEIRKFFSTLVYIINRPTKLMLYWILLTDFFRLQKILAVRYAWFLLVKKLGRPTRKQNEFRINYHIEMLPDPTNRVMLSEQKDAHGSPLAKVTWRASERELNSILRLHEEIGSLLKANSTGTLNWNGGAEPAAGDLPYSSSSHHMGTTRMGTDPETSVVDADCRVHGIENLYVAGSSIFPTAGFANPTFTIVALAIRLADTLKASLKRRHA